MHGESRDKVLEDFAEDVDLSGEVLPGRLDL
jgi:hypothetical protein